MKVLVLPRTFHRTGQAESQVLTGVPRFQELLNATKTPKGPSCKIYIKDCEKSLEEVKEIVGSHIVELTVNDICVDVSIDSKNEEKEKWYELFKIIYEDESWYRELDSLQSCIKIHLNMDKLYKYKLSLIDITKKLHNAFEDCVCIFSPEKFGELHVYFKTDDIKLDEKLLFIDDENYIDIYLEETAEPILLNTKISGINDITNIYFYQENDEWVIDTDGSNFIDILLLPFVNSYRTISNDMWEIYEILGIEAAKRYLIEEFENIIEVNKSHINILVSRMTFGGTISSISRYTMRKEKTGAISKSSFEETVDQFVRAATNGDIDDCMAVSSSIVCGNRPKFGTGMVDLKVDINAILKNDIMNKFL